MDAPCEIVIVNKSNTNKKKYCGINVVSDE